MGCPACVYFIAGGRCALHGAAREGLAFFRCLDFVDRANEYFGNPTGCCGIQNLPLLQETPASEPK